MSQNKFKFCIVDSYYFLYLNMTRVSDIMFYGGRFSCVEDA